MPWCPVCKNEYKAGYTKCSDCNATLVDSLDDSRMILTFGPEKEMDEIIKFFKVNNLSDDIEKVYDAKENLFEIRVEEEKFDFYRKRLALYLNEFKVSPEMLKEYQSEETQEEEKVQIKPYKDPKKRAEEYKSGASAMLITGILGAILLILLDMNIIDISVSYESKILINSVMGFLFFLFIVIGIKSYASYKSLLELADKNGNLESEILKWFSESVTPDMITSGESQNDGEEVKYFNRSNKIKALIFEKFPEMEPSFVEYITDKIYNDKFEE